MEGAVAGIPAAITSALSGVLAALTSVWTFVTGESVIGWFAVGIGVSLALAAVMIIRRVIWGA